MAMTGDEGGGYIRSPISPIDQMTGSHALSGILASLHGAAANGQGRHRQSLAVRNRARPARLQPADLLGARCAAAEMRLEPRVALSLSGVRGVRRTDHDRRRQRQPVAEILQRRRARSDRRRSEIHAPTPIASRIAPRRWAMSRPRSPNGPSRYWNDELARIGVPCSPINSLAQLLAHPHTAATGMILDYEHPVAGPTKGVGQPILLERRSAQRGQAAADARSAHRRDPCRDRTDGRKDRRTKKIKRRRCEHGHKTKGEENEDSVGERP